MPFEIFCLHVTEEIHGLTEWCLADRVGQVVQCGLWTGGRGLLETLVRIRVEMLQLDPVAYGDWRVNRGGAEIAERRAA